MTSLLIATTNLGKLKEFNDLFGAFSIELKSLKDFPEAQEVEETGTTFQENARLKAEALCEFSNLPTLADDSGLSIEALNGQPGVYSARYAGLDKNDQANMEKVLFELNGIPIEKRRAAFYCVLALAIPGKPTRFIEGRLDGYISLEPRGNNGFGYDPIFFVPEQKATLAEISREVKNTISHRANAFEQLKKMWPEIEREFI